MNGKMSKMLRRLQATLQRPDPSLMIKFNRQIELDKKAFKALPHQARGYIRRTYCIAPDCADYTLLQIVLNSSERG